MPALVLGPMLRYVDAAGASIWVETDEPCAVSVVADGRAHESRTFTVHGHHYAIVDLTGLTSDVDGYAVELDGDRLDAARIARLVANQDVVVSAVGSARAKTPDPAIYREAAESLVTALRSLGGTAPRLIVVGGVGSLKNESGVLLVDLMPPERRPESLGQKQALDYYQTVADVKWTYFSPALRIAPGERTGVFRLGEDRLIADDIGESRISMEDYAVALIDEAETPRHLGRRFTVGY